MGSPRKQRRQFSRGTSLVTFGEASGPLLLDTASSVGCIHTRIVTLGFAPPTRACRSQGMTIPPTPGQLGQAWHPLAVDHTHVDWIGHCTPSAQFLNKETASTPPLCCPIGYGLTQPPVHSGYRVVMYSTKGNLDFSLTRPRLEFLSISAAKSRAPINGDMPRTRRSCPSGGKYHRSRFHAVDINCYTPRATRS